jgi:hypothetical protein
MPKRIEEIGFRLSGKNANPNLIDKEFGAWANSARDKYGAAR